MTGAKLKEAFPNLLFTIGDNGTTYLLGLETKRALTEAGLRPGESRVAVLGPYGLLGGMMTDLLTREGYQVVGAGPNTAGLAEVAAKYPIEVCENFAEMGPVDGVVACTHSAKICLTKESVELIRRKGRKLLVVDVAKPSNLTQEEYQLCREVVIRQDAGNAYSPHLKYVLGAISYKMFRLSQGVTFGCFAESLSLSSALQRGDHSIRQHDWFSVNAQNMEIVAKLFEKDGFGIPSPRCFGKAIKSFSLAIE